jgi:hypothetical protein
LFTQVHPDFFLLTFQEDPPKDTGYLYIRYSRSKVCSMPNLERTSGDTISGPGESIDDKERGRSTRKPRTFGLFALLGP